MANRVGRAAEARVTATRAKNQFARVLETAERRGEVVITKHDQPKAVLLSIEKYNELAGTRVLDELAGEFDDLLAEMQTSRARTGAKRAFDATPPALGRAAAAAARKR